MEREGQNKTRQDKNCQLRKLGKFLAWQKKVYTILLFPIEVQKSTISNEWEKAVCFVRACRGLKRAAPSSNIFAVKNVHRVNVMS